MALIQLQTEIAKLGLAVGKVLDLVTDKSMVLTCADGAVIELAEGDCMVYRSADGIAKNQLGLRISKHNSLSGLCVATGQIMRCDDSRLDPRVDLAACEKVGLRSMIVVPLAHQNSVIGVLKVLSTKPGIFSDADVTILGMLSELVAASMFYAAHYDHEQLFYRATHDELTGLANRALFLDHLRTAIAQANRKKELTGVMMIDMNGLKKINDQLGHRYGDAVIREFGRRLKENSRETDTVARFGGDEFGIVLTPVDSASSVELKSQRLAQNVEKPFDFEGQRLPIGASYGGAVYPEDSREINELLDIADQAMYAQKRSLKDN
ncbi:MAG TPA: sensor domain-containing diguanylate cyclase [Methylophaga sp.]|nr:sensor domain-containing diguanylate cyclase [Methylophaga sp.]